MSRLKDRTVRRSESRGVTTAVMHPAEGVLRVRVKDSEARGNRAVSPPSCYLPSGRGGGFALRRPVNVMPDGL